MSRNSDFNFASFDGMEVAGGSGSLAVSMGTQFRDSIDSGVSSASAGVSNSLPNMTDQGVGIA